MNYLIRELKPSEILNPSETLNTRETPLLETFLYEAIFVPEGEPALSREIIKYPELQKYIANFGQEHDLCYVAQLHDNEPGEGNAEEEISGSTQPSDGGVKQKSVQPLVVGAVWTRIMNYFGHVDENTPSLSISVLGDYRGLGIGTALMKRILVWLKERGYQRVSLSVQKANYAVRMYKKLGFTVLQENETDYVMVRKLN